MNEDKRKNLEEAYEQLSRLQKLIVVLSALGQVMRHWLRLLPLRWVLMQIRIDMRTRASR